MPLIEHAAIDAARRSPSNLYLRDALADIPRLLGAIDRNPFRPTYGCLDRQYWHYRTASFPSENVPGRRAARWRWSTPGCCPATAGTAYARVPRVGRGRDPICGPQLRIADGSCDDYYPFERALGAAVFSLAAAARAYQVLELDDAEIVAGSSAVGPIGLLTHDESGRLTNHHALAALGLLARGRDHRRRRDYRGGRRERIAPRVGLAGRRRLVRRVRRRRSGLPDTDDRLPGQAIAARRATRGSTSRWPGRRLSPRCSCTRTTATAASTAAAAPTISSRTAWSCWPPSDPAAADLADGFLRSLAAGTAAVFGDDRMFAASPGEPDRGLSRLVAGTPSGWHVG